MGKVIIGALAHVDAGKTSLCEAILYQSKTIRNKGRIDNQDAFLDFNQQERDRGITIFNKEARFVYNNNEYIYLDTPGHSELKSESNRALAVIDCAVLIIDGASSVPADTISTFNNLLNYHIPIVVFMNKMDISFFEKDKLLEELKNKLSVDCTEISAVEEAVALQDESLLDGYLNGTLDKKYIREAVMNNAVIPVLFGSALKDEGVKELLDFIDTYVEKQESSSNEFSAYVYKISYENAERLTHIKILSGSLKNKDLIGDQKVNEIRLYSGKKYVSVNEADAGNLCTIKGLNDVDIGTYLPSFINERKDTKLSLLYELKCDEDATLVYTKLSVLNDETPELDINLTHRHIYIRLTGDLHKQIIAKQIKERFNLDVSFSNPIIRYKETVSKETYGVGHFEPLRHYAEVIVTIKPNENGLKIRSLVNNSFTGAMVNFISTYHPRGILTNSTLTNAEICIVDFKTHPKHTEGGDLIDALKRAIRHALSKNESILLEPYYLISIDTSGELTNRILPELINAKCMYTIEEDAILAKIPMLNFNDFILSLRQKLKDKLSYEIIDSVYEKALNQDEIVSAYGYDYLSDLRNPVGSIFTSKGAGHYVDKDEVEEKMHLNLSDYFANVSTQSVRHNPSTISEEELKRVWNSLYKAKPRVYKPVKRNEDDDNSYRRYEYKQAKPLMYLVDGYNLMYYMQELGELDTTNFMMAREKVIDVVSDYKGYVAADMILVFDAYKQEGGKEKIDDKGPITIVFTKTSQTADTYIENTAKKLSKDYKVISVTSDYLEQMKLIHNDSSIISSREFMARYANFRKSHSTHNNLKPNKPFEELKKILEFEDETDM